VQLSEAAGAVVVQLLPATVVPSERVQVTLCVAVPELLLATHEPVRVWVKPVPQPVVGVHAV
jgi:hypothetical protein